MQVKLFDCLENAPLIMIDDGYAGSVERNERNIITVTMRHTYRDAVFAPQIVELNEQGIAVAEDIDGVMHRITFQMTRPMTVADLKELKSKRNMEWN